MGSRIILITGANGGLGQAFARAFLVESKDNFVWLGVRSHHDRADALAEEFPNQCGCLSLDVTQRDVWQECAWPKLFQRASVQDGAGEQCRPSSGQPACHNAAFVLAGSYRGQSRFSVSWLSGGDACHDYAEAARTYHQHRFAQRARSPRRARQIGAAAKAGVVALTQSLG